jgi:hypothetical protein
LIRNRGLAENLVQERRQARDVVDVQHVRELVGDELVQPVVVVAERRHIVGGGREQLDRVVGHCARRAVGELRVIGEDHLDDFSRGIVEVRRKDRVSALADSRHALPQWLEAAVEVDAKVRSLDRVPLEARIAGPRLGCGESEREPNKQCGEILLQTGVASVPRRRRGRHRSSWNSGSRLRT